MNDDQALRTDDDMDAANVLMLIILMVVLMRMIMLMLMIIYAM